MRITCKSNIKNVPVLVTIIGDFHCEIQRDLFTWFQGRLIQHISFSCSIYFIVYRE